MAKKKTNSAPSKAQKPRKPRKAKAKILVVSASERNEARRLLAQHMKSESFTARERNEARRQLASEFKRRA